MPQTFGDDDLNRTHPAFIWVFRASRDWEFLQSLLPDMRKHLNEDSVARHFFPGISKEKENNGVLVADFSMIFRELFCVAADNLAHRLHQPLPQLGVLFEEPVGTGTMTQANVIQNLKHSRKLSKAFASNDPERGLVHNEHFHKGQFLFLVRQLKKGEVDDMAAQGYRFAALQQITDHLSRSLQIPSVDISKYLGRMKKYATTESLMEPGIYVTGFMLKPNLTKGFDVLVPTDAQNQLPTVALPFTTLATWQIHMLYEFDNWKISDILKVVLPEDNDNSPQDARTFKWQFYKAVLKLVQNMGDQTFVEQARFLAKPLQAPCRNTPGTETHDRCTLLSFRVITSIHGSSPSDNLVYVPLKLFNAQQQVSTGLRGLHNFTQDARTDFASMHKDSRRQIGFRSTVRSPTTTTTQERFKHSRSSSNRTVAPPNSPAIPVADGNGKRSSSGSSATPLALRPMEEEEEAQVEVHEVLVSEGESMELKEYAAVGGKNMGISGDKEERARVRESLTFVDELYALFLS